MGRHWTHYAVPVRNQPMNCSSTIRLMIFSVSYFSISTNDKNSLCVGKGATEFGELL